MIPRFFARVFQSRRFHHRKNGPVVIDPERRHIIHIYGKKP